VHRLESYDFEDEQVECALHEIGRFAHRRLTSVTDNTMRRRASERQGGRANRAAKRHGTAGLSATLYSLRPDSVINNVRVVSVR
jgi:hypothetical protein